jgi:hypothetical protein
MSTKTTIKRIALVAVAALGIGGVSTVAPANAANGQKASVISIGSAPFKTGVVNLIPITITFPSDSAATDTTTVTVQVTAAPLTGGVANAASKLGLNSAASENSADGTGDELYLTTNADGTKVSNVENAPANSSTDAAVADGYVISGQLDGSGISEGEAGQYLASAISVTPISATNLTQVVYLAVTPDLAGNYSFLIASNASGRTYYAAGDTTATATFSTTAAAATATFSVKNTAPVGDSSATSTDGVVFSVTLKDAAGNVTNLGSLDTVTFTSSSSDDAFYYLSADDTWTSMTGGVAAQGRFTNGVGWFKVVSGGTASTTNTITATASGTLGNTSMGSTSVSFKKLVTIGATEASNTLASDLATTGFDGALTDASATESLSVSGTQTSTSIAYDFAAAAAAAGVYFVTVRDVSKKIFGSAVPYVITYKSAISFSAAATGTSVSVSHGALGTGNFTVALGDASTTVVGTANGQTITITGATGVTAGTNVLSATPAGPVAASAKGTLSIVVNLVDRFGNDIPNASITASVTGRNTVAATPLITDANGNATFSYTDAGTATIADVVTFSNSSSSTVTKQVTVNYNTAAVSTVKLTTPDTTAGVANATVTIKPISAGDGAEAGAFDITATVKDANGNLLIGVPVSWTISGTGAALTTTTANGWTSADGVATASVYGWLAGTYTVTATAGGIAGTGTVTFGSTTAGNARVLSAAVEGSIVTAKVVDRFGNPVKNVTVYATKTGQGYFGAGLAKTSDTTAADGTAVFYLAGGSATVTVSTLDPAALPGTNASGQTCALAGNLTCASGATAATAFTAYVAGTSTADAEYVGSTYAPAGVSSVTVEVTNAAASDSVDAANEATDAANAATDAANAAAEAADAATAAAQDAQAAVAALANLVIKIQKKVRA